MKQMVKTIGEGTFWLSFNSVVLKVISLVSILFTLSKLGVYEYGLVQLVYSSVGLFGLFVLPGLGDMVLADMGVLKGSNDQGGMKKIFSDYFKIQIVLAVLAWAILFFGSELVAQFYKGQIGLLLKIISFSFLVSPFRSLFMLLFSLDLKFFTQSLYTLIEESCKVLLLLLFFFVFHMRADAVISAAVLSQVLPLVLFLPAFLNLKKKFAGSIVKQAYPFWHILKKHGKWTIVHDYVHNSGQHLRLFLIKFFVGTEAVGLFSVAQGFLANLVSLFPLNQTVAPILSQYSARNTKDFLRLAYKAVKYQVLGLLGLAVIAWFAVPPFVLWLFPKYEASLSLFKIMLIALVPMGYATITTIYYIFKLQRLLLSLQAIRLVSIAVLVPLLSFWFGIRGLAIEYVLTIVVYVWARNRVLAKAVPEFRLSLRHILSIDEYDKMILQRLVVYTRGKLKFLGI